MKKQCKQCSKTFNVTNDDQTFYLKIDVPEPTWCPPCREMRRMAWCNEGVLYARTCARCSKPVISQFPSNNPRTVWCITCWWKDDWDAKEYGRELDFTRPFFDQFHELELVVPHAAVATDEMSENSEYTHQAGQNKDCYLIFHATYNENCLYGYGVKKDKDCIDVHNCFESELCYEVVDVNNCYNVGWSRDCFDCSNSRFLYDCRGVSDSFMCVGLRNKKFCYMNNQLSEKEYQQKMQSINTGSYTQTRELLNQFEELKQKHPRRYVETNKTEDVTGDHLFNAKTVRESYDCRNVENVAHSSQLQLQARDCYDMYQFGINIELCYEGAMIGVDSSDVKFSHNCIAGVSALTYCIECYNGSKDCFGSYGLKKEQYVILNKQYTEQEYNNIKTRLIEHMKETGEWGEFFPMKYSHSAYNETMANSWFPSNKDTAVANGWPWQDNLPGTYGKETIQESDYVDDIKDVSDTILKAVLACEMCTRNFKIVDRELALYRNHKYPLPRKCFDCRRLVRIQQRNPRQIWHRQCMCTQIDHAHNGQCNVEFETTYSPERKEIIYCQGCYEKEVY